MLLTVWRGECDEGEDVICVVTHNEITKFLYILLDGQLLAVRHE